MRAITQQCLHTVTMDCFALTRCQQQTFTYFILIKSLVSSFLRYLRYLRIWSSSVLNEHSPLKKFLFPSRKIGLVPVSSAAGMRPKWPWPSPKKNLLRFYAGALCQFQLFENKRKEQSDARQVTGLSWTKFLAAPLVPVAGCIGMQNPQLQQIFHSLQIFKFFNRFTINFSASKFLDFFP